ncbi:MAG: LGFP repeat-containing protein [Mycobacterium sp.]
MTGQQGRFGKMAVRAGLGLVAVVAVVGAALSAATAAASPETDAYDAITAAWEAAGGETSPLGAPQGDVYPVGAGFAQNFVGGKMFFTPETGARAMYGPILDKYDSLGGPANSDLGFPNIDEVPGLVSPDSRVVTFSATDNPVMFWTPEHGAHVVRGAINAGWDKLGSSTGALGVPVSDESYGGDHGDTVTQKFSAGQLSWNSRTKAFTTVPPQLATQLTDLQVPVDPAAAINQAWRATGGASGPLGAKQGGQYQVGNDGTGQNFAGGKIYFSPVTGAGAVEGDILAKYESLGGPVGSDLGFPVGNEADGGTPGSRISTFASDDKPVIFFTPKNGAFVVRGAMKAAWDKLDGASGKLGAPVGDETVEGDVVSQKFTGGKVSWNRVTNTFSTEPANLAKSLSGLQVPGQKMPARSSAATTGFSWQWWWLGVAIAVLAGVAALAWAALWWRQRRRLDVSEGAAPTDAAELTRDDAGAEEQWSAAGNGSDTTVRLPSHYSEPPGPPSGVDLFGQSTPGMALPNDAEAEAEDPDAVDTAPTRIPSEAELGAGRHAAADHVADSGAGPQTPEPTAPVHPAIHLPLDDPYQVPEGYPVKANVGSGLYYTAESALYDDTLAEIWFTSEEAAQLNGFVKAG